MPNQPDVMNADNLIARAETFIAAPASSVWKALTDPAIIKQYMFGTTVKSGWQKGSPITWSGEWQGKSYEDKGVITAFEPSKQLQYTHYSPMTGLPDVPANYHTVTISLKEEGSNTLVTLTQDNNANEQEKQHSEKNWDMMLDGLKKSVEQSS